MCGSASAPTQATLRTARTCSRRSALRPFCPASADADYGRWLSVEEVFRAATEGSAGILGFDRLGRLEPGFRADIVFLDISHINYVPLRNAATSGGARRERRGHPQRDGRRPVRAARWPHAHDRRTEDRKDVMRRFLLSAWTSSRRGARRTAQAWRNWFGALPACEMLRSGLFRSASAESLGNRPRSLKGIVDAGRCLALELALCRSSYTRANSVAPAREEVAPTTAAGNRAKVSVSETRQLQSETDQTPCRARKRPLAVAAFVDARLVPRGRCVARTRPRRNEMMTASIRRSPRLSTFQRNGTEATSSEKARQHLADEISSAGSRISTAEEIHQNLCHEKHTSGQAETMPKMRQADVLSACWLTNEAAMFFRDARRDVSAPTLAFHALIVRRW